MAEYKVISSDSHIVEPPDLWATRLESKYRDQAPRIVRLEDGSDYWFCGDTNMVGMFPGTQVGTRFDEPEFLTPGRHLRRRPGSAASTPASMSRTWTQTGSTLEFCTPLAPSPFSESCTTAIS